MAEDLRDRQRDVRDKVRNAQGDLHESSKALASAARRLGRTRAALWPRHSADSVAAQEQVAEAVRLDTLMQARLQAAEHKLALARVALDSRPQARPRAARRDRRAGGQQLRQR